MQQKTLTKKYLQIYYFVQNGGIMKDNIISMTQAREIFAKTIGEDPDSVRNQRVLDSKIFQVISRPEKKRVSAWQLKVISP